MIENEKYEDNPFELDWGAVTPEKYNESSKEAFYVCNFLMRTEEARAIVKSFLCGRILWYDKHLPEHSSHRIRMDIRGQHISFPVLSAWKADFLHSVSNAKEGILVKMEFYTD